MTRSMPTLLEQLLGFEASEDIVPEAQELEAALLPLQPSSDAALSPALWDRIVERIEQEHLAPGTTTMTRDEGAWEPLAPGVERKVVHVDAVAGRQSFFVRMRAGAVLPAHEHRADEHCAILEGELEIGGAVYGAGTFHFAEQGVPHVPITARTDAVFFIHGAL